MSDIKEWSEGFGEVSDLRKKFTYGFEIEGAFTSQLLRDLRDSSVVDDIRIDRVDDGSISMPEIAREVQYISERELKIGVFESFSHMLRYLDFFEGCDGYRENDTCGLHIHIAPKSGEEWLRMGCLDRKIINDLQNWALENLCSCAKGRIRDNRFCVRYSNTPSIVRSDMKYNEKYRFMRNHPIGTLEFRFFSTCGHRFENVYTFFQQLFGYLEEELVEGTWKEAEEDWDTEDQEKEMDLFMEREDERTRTRRFYYSLREEEILVDKKIKYDLDSVRKALQKFESVASAEKEQETEEREESFRDSRNRSWTRRVVNGSETESIDVPEDWRDALGL